MVADRPGRPVVVSGLTKSFGRTRAVEDLSFDVAPGVVTGFLGPNGAGKTTTLRMVLGLVRPDRGSATIDGLPYTALRRPTDTVGAVLETAGFHPARSGRNHLRTLTAVAGYPVARCDEVLEMVGLTQAAGRSVGGYSLGMRQRLCLATALLGDPAVLVLDEPANGLDPEGIAWMREFLRSLAAQGRTVLVSSHVLSEVRQLVDQVVIINEGRLVRQASLAELAATDGRSAQVRTPTPDLLTSALRRVLGPGGAVDGAEPGLVRVTGLAPWEVGRLAHAEGIELHELSSGSDDLERIFFALTTGATPAEVS